MRRAAWAGMIAGAMVGCGTEPFELASSYSVSRVEGSSPPAVVGATENCDVSVTGGHLTFTETDQFDLLLETTTDCSHAGGETSEQSFGYTGTATVQNRRVTFHSANGFGEVVFQGQGTGSGRLNVVVPDLVPFVNDVSVEFTPE
jgi:hypothetical protein